MKIVNELSEQCKKCPDKDNCNNKRMVACKLREYEPAIKQSTIEITLPSLQTMLRNTSTQTQIAEQIKKNFYKNIFNINCNFK